MRGAARDGVGIPSAIEIAVRGKIKELDGGTWKAGDKGSLKCVMALNYYRYKNNNETLIEIDVENMVRIIGGVDQLAVERAALGL